MGSVFTAYSAPMPTLLSHSTSSPSWSCLIAHMNIAKCFGETVYRVTCSRAKCQSLAHNSIPLCCGQIENNLNTTLDAHAQLMLCCTSPSIRGLIFSASILLVRTKIQPSFTNTVLSCGLLLLLESRTGTSLPQQAYQAKNNPGL